MEKQQRIKQLAFSYFEGKIKKDEENILFEFINSNKRNMSLFREWEKEWMTISFYDNKNNNEWNKLLLRIKTRETLIRSIPKQKFRFRHTLYVAASIILLIGFSILFTYKSKEINHEAYFQTEVPYGEKSKIILADGSTVWLNSGSILKYSTSFNNKNREVILEGEGYFEVTKKNGIPFKVRTNEIDIIVKGTKFNVSAYKDDSFVRTTLIEGKVEIDYNDKSIDMNPGEEVFLNKETGEIRNYRKDNLNTNTWIENNIEYDDISIDELMVILSRKYDIKITIQNEKLKDSKFSISLRNDESIDQIFNAINKIIPIKIKKENKEYFIN